MRKLDNWLLSYKKYIIKQESPSIYHFWVASQMITATLRRNVWIDRDAYRIYPNQYVVLVAKSGTCRKSVAMEIGLDLLNDVKDLSVLHERMTVEGLLDNMQRVLMLPNGRVVPDGSVLIHADELSNLFGKAAYISDLMSFVTAAYSSKTKLDFTTRTKGVVSVRNPCLTILAGTTPEQMSEIFPSMALTSGLIGRILLVVGERGARVSKPKLRKELRDPLIHDLNEISKLYGEIKVTDEADAAFDKWYKKFPDIPPAELSAYYERKHDHVWKAAIILSVAESDNMVITLDHFKKAVQVVELVESKMADVLTFIGATAQSTIADLVVSMIRTNHPEPMSHSVLLRKIYRRLQSKGEFKDIVDTLIEANRISMTASKRGIFYTLGKKEKVEDKPKEKNDKDN